MNYEYLIPDFDMKPFCQMTAKEAKFYYKWFISEILNRNKLLTDRVLEENGIILDYSEKSLEDIWAWYERYIYYTELSWEDYLKKLDDRPDWVLPYISDKELSVETIGIGLDVAIYFGTVFVNHSNGKIQWECNTKKSHDRNETVLAGFSHGLFLSPQKAVVKLARQSSEKSNAKRLIEFYDNWKGYVPGL